jgi:hypothetical protein
MELIDMIKIYLSYLKSYIGVRQWYEMTILAELIHYYQDSI